MVRQLDVDGKANFEYCDTRSSVSCKSDLESSLGPRRSTFRNLESLEYHQHHSKI
jgi:hypothetical protein